MRKPIGMVAIGVVVVFIIQAGDAVGVAVALVGQNAAG
jgi:hypothetical protein